MVYLFYVIVGVKLILLNKFYLKPSQRKPVISGVGIVAICMGASAWLLSLYTDTIGPFALEDVLGISGPFIFFLILLLIFKRDSKLK